MPFAGASLKQQHMHEEYAAVQIDEMLTLWVVAMVVIAFPSTPRLDPEALLAFHSPLAMRHETQPMWRAPQHLCTE